MSLFDNGLHKLYDRVIKVTLIRKADPQYKIEPFTGKASRTNENYSVIEIPFTQGGYKPNIEVKVSMLPSAICFNMTVKLTNCHIIKNADVRDFSLMKVEMGYTNNRVNEDEFTTEVFTGPVFSSYIEKPSPDNVMVFEGIVVGEVGTDLFRTRPYTVKFYESQYSVLDIIAKIAHSTGMSYSIEYCDRRILDAKLRFGEGSISADNVYALINWMQSAFHSWCQNNKKEIFKGVAEDTGIEFFVYIKDNCIYLVSNIGSLNDSQRRQAATLNFVKSASFTGPALTVTALYNPRVHPGDVICMPPIYYKGGAGLLNIMSKNTFNPDDGYYRVLKMDVDFGTMGNTNEMVITAFPISLYQDINAPDAITKKVEEVAKEQKEKLISAAEGAAVTKYREDRKQQIYDDIEGTIIFGEPPREKKEDVPPESTWTKEINVTQATDRRPVAGENTLSDVARNTWGSERFYLSNSELTETFNRYDLFGVPIYFFFPIIMLATYKAMKKDPKKYKIDIKNPQMLYADYNVVVPPLTPEMAKQYIGDQEVIALFKDVAQYYTDMEMEGYSKEIWDIINYLEKGRRS